MTRLLSVVGLSALLTTALLAQSASTPPAAFELADVHVSPKSTNLNMRGGAIRGGRYELRNATMVDLIRVAYDVNPDTIMGGPNWLELDRFDVIAKLPETTTLPVARQMLRTLLAERFTLVARQDNQSASGYALTVVGGKHKMKEAPDGATSCQGQPQQGQTGPIQIIVVTCKSITMEALARQFSGGVLGYALGPIADKTELKGSFDFELKVTPRPQLALAGSDGISLFDALEQQLGLKLAQGQISRQALIVESVNRTPSPNAPGVATAIPTPPPPEFEVAELKPSAPDAPGPRAQVLPTGQVFASAVPLRLLIRLAWNINSDEMIDGPKFLDTAKFDLVAKAFSGPAGQQQIDDVVLREMLKALVVDRFKMKTHYEDRPVTAYVLTSVKPKMTKADPAARTRCYEGPAPGARDPRIANPLLSRLLTCQNMTVAQLAERLPNLANGYIQTAVFDSTGLDGGWDFALSFSPAGIFQQATGRGGAGAGPNGAPNAGAAVAIDPNGALSLQEAIDRQLGLKMDTQKRPLPVLVLDHVEEKPTEN